MPTLRNVSLVLGLLSALALAAAAPSRALAQEATGWPDGTHHAVGLDGGLDSALVARATFTQRLPLDFVRDPRLYARFTLPVASPDLGDVGFDLGVQLTALSWRDFRLAVRLGPSVRLAENDLFSAVAFGASVALLAGYEGPHFGLSLELADEAALATHLAHSDRYRQTFYAGAEDGWYGVTGNIVRAGLVAGARIGRVEVSARAGVRATTELEALAPPFYATLGAAYAF